MKSMQLNKSLFLFILFMYSVSLFAQDCHTKARSNGIAAYNKEDFKEALKHFDFALNVCDDAPTDNDIAEWIKKCESKQQEADLQSALQSIYDNMVYVEAGTFQMGSNDSDAHDDEKPVHQVTIGSFSISRYEVTQKQWKAVMGSNPSSFKGENLPVESVNWDEVQRFISKLNQLTGKRYRLPTEAEWEFAARGGNRSNGYKYAGGNSIRSVAWYDDNDSIFTTHPVGQKQSNELGLYDMSGNVFEWCSDWYGKYSSTVQTNPKGASSVSWHVSRGGGLGSSAWHCRVSHRDNYFPDDCNYNLGFRLCL